MNYNPPTAPAIDKKTCHKYVTGSIVLKRILYPIYYSGKQKEGNDGAPLALISQPPLNHHSPQKKEKIINLSAHF